MNIDDFQIHEPTNQLDAFLYPAIEPLPSELIEPRVKIAEKPLGIDWFK